MPIGIYYVFYVYQLYLTQSKEFCVLELYFPSVNTTTGTAGNYPCSSGGNDL